MAYGDSGSKFWQIDLTTRAGALGAAKQGGVACFILCGLSFLGILVSIVSLGAGNISGLLSIAVILIEAGLFLAAGLRLRAGKGVVLGIIAFILAVAELALKIVTFSIGGTIIIGIACIALVQGIRGALALRKDEGFDDDLRDVFS